MDFNQINQLNSEEVIAKAEARAAEAKAKAANLAKAYNRLFKSEEGQKVLADLTQSFIYNNDTPFNAQNINYEAAYHNGESGVVKYIISKIQQAEIL